MTRGRVLLFLGFLLTLAIEVVAVLILKKTVGMSGGAAFVIAIVSGLLFFVAYAYIVTKLQQ
jgi:hypothetical protein